MGWSCWWSRGHSPSSVGSGSIRTGTPCGARWTPITTPQSQPDAQESRWRRRLAWCVEGALDLFLPRTCLVCACLQPAGVTALVCSVCWSRLAFLPHPQCPRCGHPKTRSTCTWCGTLPAFVRAARSVCWAPHGTAGTLLHAFKYAHWPRLAEEIASRMARLSWPPDVLRERSLLVPVPLASSRLRERGYNQSELLARALAPHWGLPVLDALARSRATATQTRLTPGDRLRNVAGAFVATVPKGALAGEHVVLVDDVVTTAATLNACATALFEGGARIVSYVTFGRARAAGDRHSEDISHGHSRRH